MRYFIRFLPLLVGFWAIGQMSAQSGGGVVRVEIKQGADGWELLRGGAPYYVNGVGGTVHLDRAKAYGANSVRTWSAADASKVLDDAQAKGMTVLFGLWVGQERQGFDYEDSKNVKAQLERFTEVVKTYKDHPALLMWGIGNENDLFYNDFSVWNAINDIAKMIHEEDPNHPTMTVTAGLDVAEVQLIQERAPHIDILGINTYGGLIGIDKQVRAFGWTKPYMITEWGPNGHWEVAKTSWGVPLEQSSTLKASWYKKRYAKGISEDKSMCIGSYVFLWGQKQETTPTWYGIFLEDGSETEVVDVLEHAWSGKWPANKSPKLESYTLNGKQQTESIKVNRRQKSSVELKVIEPESEPLKYRLEILPESTDIKAGGDKEDRPSSLDIVFESTDIDGTFTFSAPKKSGPYRLFIYAYDEHQNAAVANIPFYVN
ncbi:MAG: glycoside hydrolase family 2 TIM barrel-domain containing protein [Saprospiraceae bacterium]